VKIPKKYVTITLSMKQAKALLAAIDLAQGNPRPGEWRARQGAVKILESTIKNVEGPQP
jgi:hypothetical protein